MERSARVITRSEKIVLVCVISINPIAILILENLVHDITQM